ncbi:MAG TPA: DUF2269 family protein [Solirubrobacteraceae bacterium]|nr:DUF2269 family protein [Solirubrobacteraceae bacterium]
MILATGVFFWQVVLAIHIAAVVITFGVTFAYPVFFVVGTKLDPRAIPWFHRMQRSIARRIINPGLTVVLIAGIYLASKLGYWHFFFVQWGIAVVIILGGLEGAFMIRKEAKLAELAERDIAAAGNGEVTFGDDYAALAKRVGAVGVLMNVLVLATIYLMTIQS